MRGSELLGIVWSEMARSRRLQILFVVVVVTIALTAALSATIPLLFAWGIDALAAPTRDPEAVRYVIAFGAGLVLVGVMEQAQWLTFGPLNLLLQRNLTTRVFSHALSLPHYRLKGFTTYEIGRIVEKGLDAVREITSNLVFFVVPTFIELAIAAWVIAYAVDAWIAAWLFSALLVYGAITNLAAAKLRRSTGEAMEKGMDAWSFGLDGVANSELVQQSNWVGLFGARLDEKLRQSDRAWAATFRQRTLYGVLQALVFGIVVLAVLWRGATDVENGALTIGELVLLNGYIIRLLQPVETFARVYREIHASTGEVRLLADLLSLPAAPAPTALHLSPTPFSLELAGVSLSVNDRRLVSGLNLAVPSRSTLYVVGPSGVGKSSLLRVLSCLAMPDRGRYRIDGMAVDERTMAGFREHIAVVQQECLLFDWTVRENVAFGGGDPCRDRRGIAAGRPGRGCRPSSRSWGTHRGRARKPALRGREATHFAHPRPAAQASPASPRRADLGARRRQPEARHGRDRILAAGVHDGGGDA